MGTRGRKPKKDPYFGLKEEMAVVKFINSDDYEERNKIYNEELRKPIEKLVESIIRTYKLYRDGFTYEEIHADTVSFLTCQTKKFRPEENKKAYSYYGTICKNYLIYEINKDKKKLKNNYSFDDYFSILEGREDLSYIIDEPEVDINSFITDVVDEIKLTLNDTTLEGRKKLNDNEIKLGYALVDILSNWEAFFEKEDHTAKYDKNSILATIRNYTNLSTKDIRGAMGKFKVIYKLLKNTKIDDGLM